MNFRYPIFLDLTGKNCLVTGEGYEVAVKVQDLVDAPARTFFTSIRKRDAEDSKSLAEPG